MTGEKVVDEVAEVSRDYRIEGCLRQHKEGWLYSKCNRKLSIILGRRVA